MSAWVDSAPTPARACGHSAPTAKKRLATATPRAPEGSRARIDQVTREMVMQLPAAGHARYSRAFMKFACLLALSLAATGAASAQAPLPPAYPVGLRQVEFVDNTFGPRTLTMNVFYPARLPSPAPAPFAMGL